MKKQLAILLATSAFFSAHAQDAKTSAFNVTQGISVGVCGGAETKNLNDFITSSTVYTYSLSAFNTGATLTQVLSGLKSKKIVCEGGVPQIR